MKKQIMAVLLVLCMGMTGGCQKTGQKKAPQLKDSSTSSEKTYVVERQDILRMNTENGFVEGVRECALANTSGTIAEIKKQLGDTVKKGDVIATVTSGQLQTQRDILEKQVSSERAQHLAQLQVYELQKKKLRAERRQLRKIDASQKEQKLCDVKLDEITHRIRYENERYQIASSHNEQQLQELKEELSHSAVTAPCDGTIGGFLLNVGMGSEVEQDMPVAVVFNENKKVLVYSSDTYDEWEDFPRLSVRMKDQEYELTEYEYTKQERKNLIRAKLQVYPCYQFDDIDKMEMTTAGVILGRSEEKKQVLAVPNAAVCKETEGSFVYVERDGKSQRVQVQTGASDNSYTEITQGLSEGETVLYTQYDSLFSRVQQLTGQGMTPVKAKLTKGDRDYVVALEQYSEDEQTGLVAPQTCRVVDEEENTVFEKLAVNNGDIVKKGDVIAYVDHGVKQSEKLSAANAVTQAQQTLKQQESEYEEQLSQYQKQIAKADSAYEKKQLAYDVAILKATHKGERQQAQQTLTEAEVQQQELLDKASDVVRAPISGTVGECCATREGGLLGDTALCVITPQAGQYVRIEDWGYALHHGMRVTLHGEDGKNYKGTVVYAGNDVAPEPLNGDSEEIPAAFSTSGETCVKLDKAVSTSELRVTLVEHAQKQLVNVMLLTGKADLYWPASGATTPAVYSTASSDNGDIGTAQYSCDHSVLLEQEDGSYTTRDVRAHSDNTAGDYWVISGLTEKDTVVYPELSDVELEE